MSRRPRQFAAGAPVHLTAHAVDHESIFRIEFDHWAMLTLNGVYASEFNQRHRRRGHLFGERYKDTPVASDLHLRAAQDYVIENPVRAGLVRRPEQWRWSGESMLEPREVNVAEPSHSRSRTVRSRR